jgi:hypothetical protein
MLVELGDGLVRGADGRLEAVGDELRLAQRATTRRVNTRSSRACQPVVDQGSRVVAEELVARR